MSKEPPVQFNGKASVPAHDEAMLEVADAAGAWMVIARHALEQLPRGWQGTGEDIRRLLTTQPGGLPAPHHPTVWQVLIDGAVRKGVLEWTGTPGNSKVYRRPW